MPEEINYIDLTEDNSCPMGKPGDLAYPDPGSKTCQQCPNNKETKRNDDRVHDMCPIWLVKCMYPFK